MGTEEKLLEAIADLGDPAKWNTWPGGWPGDVESALVDAVFSARARFETTHGRGVLAQVRAWQATRGDRSPRLSALRQEIAAVGVEQWARRFGNEQHAPSRPRTAIGGPTKAAAVLEAADLLSANGIDTANDVLTNAHDTKRLLRKVDGIGFATVNYFLMLLGAPGVKPDRMIHAFIRDAIGSTVSDAQADRLITVSVRISSVSSPTSSITRSGLGSVPGHSPAPDPRWDAA